LKKTDFQFVRIKNNLYLRGNYLETKKIKTMAENKTQDTLRRLFYASVGLATEASERIQEIVDDLVEKGKMSEKEGQKIVNDLLKKTEGRRGQIEQKYNETVKKFVRLTASEVEKLSRKIEKLENQLLIKSAKATVKPAAKPAAKKAVAKKATPAKKAAKTTAKPASSEQPEA
jgi:polyhydroxyalkanoate synthesis regulator phasin